jgi:hypothetical protein
LLLNALASPAKLSSQFTTQYTRKKKALDLIADFTPETEDPQWYWLHTLLQNWVGEGLVYSRESKMFIKTEAGNFNGPGANLGEKKRWWPDIFDEVSWRNSEFQKCLEATSVSHPKRISIARSMVAKTENALKMKWSWHWKEAVYYHTVVKRFASLRERANRL